MASTSTEMKDNMLKQKRIFTISGNNKGLACPFKVILCQEGYCHQCQIYIDWLQKRGEMAVICSWCGTKMGRKPGLGKTGISHGICDECQQKYFPEALGSGNRNDLGKILKQRRFMIPLTLQEMARASGISQSHLSLIERGKRFPSALILRKIAKHLGIDEFEIFFFTGYLSSQRSSGVETPSDGQLDPYVAKMLSQEPSNVQRSLLAILSMLKLMAQGVAQENSGSGTK